MAKQTVARLADTAPASDLTPLDDIAGRDLLLLSAEPAISDRFGAAREGYKVVLQEVDGTKNTYESMVFGQVCVPQLKKAMEKDPFSQFVVRFEKQGRAWVIV